MSAPSLRGPRKSEGETISFNLTAEQVEKIVKIRQLRGMTTGEVVRRACDFVDEATLRRNPAPAYDHHLTVSLPAPLRKKVEELADACDMKISDVVRRACEAFFDKQLGQGS